MNRTESNSFKVWYFSGEVKENVHNFFEILDSFSTLMGPTPIIGERILKGLVKDTTYGLLDFITFQADIWTFPVRAGWHLENRCVQWLENAEQDPNSKKIYAVLSYILNPTLLFCSYEHTPSSPIAESDTDDTVELESPFFGLAELFNEETFSENKV